MREIDLFQAEPRGEDLVISHVSDEDGWRSVKDTLLKTVGMGSVPVIHVADADHGGNRTLLLTHAYEGRDLQLEYAERTLAFVHRLWGRDVLLETTVNGKKTALTYSDKGFSAKAVK
jgi:stage V sporulation protein R